MEPVILPEMRRDIALADREAYRSDHSGRSGSSGPTSCIRMPARPAPSAGSPQRTWAGVRAIVHTFHGHVLQLLAGCAPVYKNIERFGPSFQPHHRHQRTAAGGTERSPGFLPKGITSLWADLTCSGSDQDTKRRLFRHVYGVADDEIAVGIIGPSSCPSGDHDLFIEALHRVSRTTGV